jgi:hypothetical protein
MLNNGDKKKKNKSSNSSNASNSSKVESGQYYNSDGSVDGNLRIPQDYVGSSIEGSWRWNGVKPRDVPVIQQKLGNYGEYYPATDSIALQESMKKQQLDYTIRHEATHAMVKNDYNFDREVGWGLADNPLIAISKKDQAAYRKKYGEDNGTYVFDPTEIAAHILTKRSMMKEPVYASSVNEASTQVQNLRKSNGRDFRTRSITDSMRTNPEFRRKVLQLLVKR